MSETTYNINTVTQLISEAKNLNSFADVKSWDDRAKEEIQKIEHFINAIKSESTLIEQKLEKESTERNKLSLFKKIFSTNSVANSYTKQLKTYSNYVEMLEETKSGLEEWIAKTPDDEQEANQMIKELKLAKKELAAQKKEIRADIKQINTDARIGNANISNQVIFTNTKLKQAQRIMVRHQKESSLKPHEQTMQNIERQLLDIDRTIIWLEKIKF